MGLDIYLYRSKNYKKHLEFKTLQEQIDNAGEDAWPKDKKYDELTPEEKEKYSADGKVAKLKKAKELGVKVDEKAEYSWDMIKDEYEEEIKEDSKKYPEHMFKIGYCRSSYNPGGINHILDDRLGYNLYQIFEYDDDTAEYEFKPNWKNVKKNAEKAIKELNAYFKDSGAYGVMEVRTNEFKMKDIMEGKNVPTSEKEALDKFTAVRKQHEDQGQMGNFGNAEGEYFLKDPLKVVAIIAGANKRFFVDQYLPSQFVIYESDKADFEWYIQSLEIVVEMCDYVLADKNKDNTYYLHWSA